MRISRDLASQGSVEAGKCLRPKNDLKLVTHPEIELFAFDRERVI